MHANMTTYVEPVEETSEDSTRCVSTHGVSAGSDAAQCCSCGDQHPNDIALGLPLQGDLASLLQAEEVKTDTTE
ncbi:hypothetical protein GN958_ATG03376 [Phytophthora infestans]|uniref:Uncharacterized protein n=1 Tax=Phytophthora infestans TaxID=4787 RepID=A0A8S9V3K6_PHYIN|nr:hypothetical protein GN958_ATG03376 [Phytophthora infestans]